MTCLAGTRPKQAAPANDPAFGCSTALSNGGTVQSRALGNSRESPAFTFTSRDT